MKFLALALVVLLVPQDDKLHFKFAPKQGDKITETSRMDFKIVMDVEAGGQTQEIEVEQKQTEKKVIEFAAVEDGKVTRKIVDTVEDFEEHKRPPKMEWEREDKPLHGRKVTVLVKGDATTYEGADGLTEKDLKGLTSENRVQKLYPKTPLSVGDTWEVKGEEIQAFLEMEEKIKKGSVKLKFDSIKEIDKRRCAILKATIDLTAEAQNEIEFRATIEGDLVIWLERGYLLEFKGKGKVTMKAENDQFTLSGKGDISFEHKAKVE